MASFVVVEWYHTDSPCQIRRTFCHTMIGSNPQLSLSMALSLVESSKVSGEES